MAAYDAWTGAPFTLAPARLLLISGRPGDPISGGRSVNLALSGANPWTYWMSANALDDEGSWYALFDIGREPWATGVFDGADASNGPPPSLSVQHAGSSCQSNGGRFTVNDVEIGPRRSPGSDLNRLRATLRRRDRALLWRPPLQQQHTARLRAERDAVHDIGGRRLARDVHGRRVVSDGRRGVPVLRPATGDRTMDPRARVRGAEHGHLDSAISGHLHHPALGAPPWECGELRILCQRSTADGEVTTMGLRKRR